MWHKAGREHKAARASSRAEGLPQSSPGLQPLRGWSGSASVFEPELPGVAGGALLAQATEGQVVGQRRGKQKHTAR